MDYASKFFKSYELVPRGTYNFLKERPWVIWHLFDPRTLQVNDLLRKRYGKMVMNTWYWGGKHQYRGWRPPSCKIGSRWSQHRFGRASDLIPMEVTVEEIRQDIKDGENFHHITCIEDNVGWLHHDERNYKGLLIVYP